MFVGSRSPSDSSGPPQRSSPSRRRRTVALTSVLVLSSLILGCSGHTGDGGATDNVEIAEAKSPGVDRIVEELGCDIEIDLHGDPLSKVEGHGVVCVEADRQAQHTYVMQYEGLPAPAFDNRIWEESAAAEGLVVFNDAYIMGPAASTHKVMGATALNAEQIAEIRDNEAHEYILSAEEFDCRSFLTTAIAGDFLAAAEGGQEFIDEEAFASPDDPGRDLVLDARETLALDSSEELNRAAENPGLNDYYAEAHASRYTTGIVESCKS